MGLEPILKENPRDSRTQSQAKHFADEEIRQTMIGNEKISEESDSSDCASSSENDIIVEELQDQD